ncbi:Malectin-like domain [Dillenia turbinata]|uniref:Malectin-like domain n=1 Tax=Dillenia turbinata TaxID=194707 RepID=A0AAN8WFY4_9MAGN
MDYHSAMVALLALISAATDDEQDCLSDRILRKRELLENMMPALKGLFGACNVLVALLMVRRTLVNWGSIKNRIASASTSKRYYGNYDGRSKPPKFDLEFDGFKWTLVVTSLVDPVYSEMIYATKGDNVSLCRARAMDDWFPFISTLEAFPLRDAMHAGFTRDLAWFTPTPADAITLSFPLSNGNHLGHVVVDLTEVAEMEINETGQFDFYVNGEKMFTLNPEYGMLKGLDKFTIGRDLDCRATPTRRLTLPLIISAIEVYTASDSLVTTGTSHDDFEPPSQSLSLLLSYSDKS